MRPRQVAIKEVLKSMSKEEKSKCCGYAKLEMESGHKRCAYCLNIFIPQEPSSESWEERFDELILKMKEKSPDFLYGVALWEIKELKNFIRTLLAQSRTETIEEVIGKCEDMQYSEPMCDPEMGSYNKALQDLITSIRK